MDYMCYWSLSWTSLHHNSIWPTAVISVQFHHMTFTFLLQLSSNHFARLWLHQPICFGLYPQCDKDWFWNFWTNLCIREAQTHQEDISNTVFTLFFYCSQQHKTMPSSVWERQTSLVPKLWNASSVITQRGSHISVSDCALMSRIN